MEVEAIEQGVGAFHQGANSAVELSGIHQHVDKVHMLQRMRVQVGEILSVHQQARRGDEAAHGIC